MVKGQFLTAKDIFAGTLALSLEITSGADICPLHILAFTQLAESLDHGRGKGLEHIWEIGVIGDVARFFAGFIMVKTNLHNTKFVSQHLKYGLIEKV